MSEEQQAFGKESIEQSQNYSPMPLAVPDPPKDYDDIDVSQPISPEDAGKFLVERRAETERATQEPVERAYNYASGERAGQTMPDNNVVPLERAATDLSGIRAAEVNAEQNALDLELQRQIDAARSGEEPQQQAFQQEQPQSAVEQPQPGNDPAADWKPHQIAAIQENQNQWVQAFEQRDAQHRQDLAQNAQITLAAATAQFPELKHVKKTEDVPLIISIVGQSNPQKAAAMDQAWRATLQNYQQLQAMDAQQQQQAAAQYQERWGAFAKEQDAKFTNKYPDISQKTRDGAIEYLRNVGFSEDDLSKSWNGQYSWSPRDARVQEIIRDASLYRQAQKTAKARMANPVPTVQRPGSPAERISQEDFNARQLSAKLDSSTGRDALKAGAALLSSRRAGR